MDLTKHFNNIGLVAEEKSTKYSGVVVSVSVDMDGTAQAKVVSLKQSDYFWFDMDQLTFSKDRIFDVMYPLTDDIVRKIKGLYEKKVNILYTEIEGVVSSICFDSDGSISIAVCDPLNNRDVLPDFSWVTLNRIILTN